MLFFFRDITISNITKKKIANNAYTCTDNQKPNKIINSIIHINITKKRLLYYINIIRGI